MKTAPASKIAANKIDPQNAPSLSYTTPVTSLLTHSAMLENATTLAATSALAPAVENKMLKKLTPTMAIPPSKKIAKTKIQYLSLEIETPDALSSAGEFFEVSTATFGLFLISKNSTTPMPIMISPSIRNENPSEKVVRKNSTIDGKNMPEKLDPEVAIPT